MSTGSEALVPYYHAKIVWHIELALVHVPYFSVKIVEHETSSSSCAILAASTCHVKKLGGSFFRSGSKVGESVKILH